MDLNQFQAALKLLEPEEFCRQHLFSSNAWIFTNSCQLEVKGTYDDFRKTVGNIINEPEENVAIVGSSKFGFSMNPHSPFNPFNADSDVDIILVSQNLFQRTWAAYREAYYNGYRLLKGLHGGNVFRNFVIVPAKEYKEFKSIYLRKIWLQMRAMERDIQTSHRISIQINFRIYDSWLDAEAYHSYGLRKLKEALP